MTLADSGRAIGAVTKLLHEHLIRRHFAVSVGKPEAATAAGAGATLNLFLYEAAFDSTLRNVPLYEDQPPPLWLTLKYLLTAFDDAESSDSEAAHELLGRGLSALHDLNFLRLDASVAADVRAALENSREPLKLTFDDSPPELISKIMQGTDEKYRLSVAFQVRPVMIAPEEPPRFPLLVGIDYTQAPPATIGEAGIGLAVIPSLGPRITAVEPPAFDPGDTISVLGEDLHLAGLECRLGAAELAVVGQRPERLTLRVDGPIAAGGAISAGEHPLVVRQPLPRGRHRDSNLLVGALRPVVTGATLAGGLLTIDGLLLGTWDDDLLVALQRDGAVARLLEAGPPPPPAPAPLTVVPSSDQTALTVSGVNAGAVPAGDYLVVVRVNGQQALRSPTVSVA
jgi:hypothetical protein